MATITPSYEGYVHTTKDALLLIAEAAADRLPTVTRRPHDRERNTLISSGNIFIYNEASSSIKRWTDGVSWSPSRISGNFLLYRELVKGFPPGHRRKAHEKTERPRGKETDHTLINRAEADPGYLAESTYGGKFPPEAIHQLKSLCCAPDFLKALHGSLIDSYSFKDGGLCKKTISVKMGDESWHMVSYYFKEDALAGRLMVPRFDPRFATTVIPTPLTKQTYRVPVNPLGEEMPQNNAGPALTYQQEAYSAPYAANRNDEYPEYPQERYPPPPSYQMTYYDAARAVPAYTTEPAPSSSGRYSYTPSYNQTSYVMAPSREQEHQQPRVMPEQEPSTSFAFEHPQLPSPYRGQHIMQDPHPSILNPYTTSNGSHPSAMWAPTMPNTALASIGGMIPTQQQHRPEYAQPPQMQQSHQQPQQPSHQPQQSTDGHTEDRRGELRYM